MTALFPKLDGLSFFEDSWEIPEGNEADASEKTETDSEETAEELPY